MKPAAADEDTASATQDALSTIWLQYTSEPRGMTLPIKSGKFPRCAPPIALLMAVWYRSAGELTSATDWSTSDVTRKGDEVRLKGGVAASANAAAYRHAYRVLLAVEPLTKRPFATMFEGVNDTLCSSLL